MASVSTSIDIGSPPDRVRDLVTGRARLSERVAIHRECGGVGARRAGQAAEASLQRLEQLTEA